jgi:hypothetical protein
LLPELVNALLSHHAIPTNRSMNRVEKLLLTNGLREKLHGPGSTPLAR